MDQFTENSYDDCVVSCIMVVMFKSCNRSVVHYNISFLLLGIQYDYLATQNV